MGSRLQQCLVGKGFNGLQTATVFGGKRIQWAPDCNSVWWERESMGSRLQQCLVGKGFNGLLTATVFGGKRIQWAPDCNSVLWERDSMGSRLQQCWVGNGFNGLQTATVFGGKRVKCAQDCNSVWWERDSMGFRLQQCLVGKGFNGLQTATVFGGKGIQWAPDCNSVWWGKGSMGSRIQQCLVGKGFNGLETATVFGGKRVQSAPDCNSVWWGKGSIGSRLQQCLVGKGFNGLQDTTVFGGKRVQWARDCNSVWWEKGSIGSRLQQCLVGKGFNGLQDTTVFGGKRVQWARDCNSVWWERDSMGSRLQQCLVGKGFNGLQDTTVFGGKRDCHYRPPTLPHAQHGWLKKENTQIDVNTWSGLCDGNGMLHDYLLNFTKEFLQQDHPAKWAAIDLNAGHRAEDESINQVDRELAEFLRSVLSENNNLTVFILGDHGKTYQSFPSHIGGYYETQLPFLSIILPNKLLDENPSMVDVLIVNQERYIVQSDLHKTMKSLIQYPLAVSGSVAPQAINILTDIIPRNRTCEEAGLPSWSCVCGTMKKMSDFEWQEKHTRMAQLALDFVNAKHKQLKKKNISSCLDLHLSKINHIFMNENPSSNSEWTTLYQITFQTIEKLTTWQAVVDDLFDIKQVKHVSLYQRFEVCQDKEVPLQYCVCDHPTN
uniref:Uncharacterized protein LOC102801711 n=1 Tax=Saccoglossus kowalevskii TaxID=10224 RepID=A0ABM0M761_SACKO|nr:PREDICTED: uncharacterized protein LOC102801711 [Saccoglossus kowalevskii]